MFGSAILDIAIGIIFLYSLIALAASVIIEIIQSIFNLRGRMLLGGIREQLDPETPKTIPAASAPPASLDSNSLFQHPVMPSLTSAGSFPQYVNPSLLSSAILDLCLSGGEAGQGPANIRTLSAEDLRAKINAISGNDTLKRRLHVALQRASLCATYRMPFAEAFQKEIETLFDTALNTVQRRFKQNIFIVNLACSIGLCLMLNADTLQISRTLYHDKALRDSVVQLAGEHQDKLEVMQQQGASAGDIAAQRKDYRETIATLQSAFPLGWTSENIAAYTSWSYAQKASGVLITALAVSLGASFWFKLLGNLIRLTGRRVPAPSEESGITTTPSC